MTKERFKVCTFSKQLTPEEAEAEKSRDTSLGESLREADRQHEKRKR